MADGPRSADGAPPAAGPRRADAQRNRARLLETALAAFTTAESEGSAVSLEAIARDAGVGIGTLYRHFPSREALVAALHERELAALCDEVRPLLAAQPPAQALRTWMNRYVDFVVTKRGMAEALRGSVASGAVTAQQVQARLADAVAALLAAGSAAGTLRDDVLPMDVVKSLLGVVLAADVEPGYAQARRMIDLLADGLARTS